jgi:hypothetical protein
MDVKLADFQPINTWKPDLDRKNWNNDGETQFIIDLSTNNRYLNDSPTTIRVKCFLLTIGTPIVHAIAALLNVALRIVRLVTFYNFFATKASFEEAFVEDLKDLARILVSPLVPIGLELAALYGVLNPRDGRKLYASIERAFYGNAILARCFQPNPTSHLLGGSIEQKNAY